MKKLLLTLAALNAGKLRREFDENELVGSPVRRPQASLLKALRPVELGANRSRAYVKRRQKKSR